MIFTVKQNVVSEISKVLLNDVIAELDGNNGIKNITERLNLGGLQVDDISANVTAEFTNKYIPNR